MARQSTSRCRMRDSRALIRFTLRRYVHDRLTWLGLLVFVLVAALGAAQYWRSLPPRPEGGRLLIEAYLAGLSLAFHLGIARDRITRFDSFLISNFVSVRDLYLANVASGLLVLATAVIIGFVLALTLSLGDVQYAVKYASLLLMWSILLVPLIALTELAFNSRYSLPLLLFMLFVTTVVYHSVADVRPISRFLGLGTDVTAAAIAIRCVAGVLLAAVIFPVYQLRMARTRL